MGNVSRGIERLVAAEKGRNGPGKVVMVLGGVEKSVEVDSRGMVTSVKEKDSEVNVDADKA